MGKEAPSYNSPLRSPSSVLLKPRQVARRARGQLPPPKLPSCSKQFYLTIFKASFATNVRPECQVRVQTKQNSARSARSIDLYPILKIVATARYCDI